MARPSITWLITDTHWNHDRMFDLCNRPLDYNKRIISNCKYVIAKQDTLIHLGDVIFYQYPTLKDLLGEFPCKKILVMGNHDHQTKGWYERNGFDFVCDGLRLNEVYFSHKPEKKLPKDVFVNIHGHWHNKDPKKELKEGLPEWYNLEKYILLSLEKENYKPVKLHEVIDNHKNYILRNARETAVPINSTEDNQSVVSRDLSFCDIDIPTDSKSISL